MTPAGSPKTFHGSLIMDVRDSYCRVGYSRTGNIPSYYYVSRLNYISITVDVIDTIIGQIRLGKALSSSHTHSKLHTTGPEYRFIILYCVIWSIEIKKLPAKVTYLLIL